MIDMEAEANLFAMHLLMPEDLVRQQVKRMRAFDLTNDKHVAELARKFQVPNSVMAIRLGMLMASPSAPAPFRSHP